MTKQSVWLWIPKFGEQVLIDPDHPLAAVAAELPPQPDQSEEVAGDDEAGDEAAELLTLQSGASEPSLRGRA